MIAPTQTVGTIVLDHPASVPIFQKLRIDFCCRGHVTLEQACAARGLDPAEVLAELDDALAHSPGAPAADPRALGTPELIEHIVSRHHAYLRRTLPYLETLAVKVARVHGDRNRKLADLVDIVTELRDTLEPHLDLEESDLFPVLAAGARDGVPTDLAIMHHDHLEVARLLERLRAATDDFRVPAWGCTSYRTLFAQLAMLDEDVLRHVHLENHVLLPRFASNAPA